MDRVFNKIILMSLCDNFSREVGRVLSQSLGMLFCDCKDLIEYELINPILLQQLCTQEYIKQKESGVFRHISTFENVVVAIGFDDLLHHNEILKEKSLIVFVTLPLNFVKQKGEKINTIAYKNRTETACRLADISIEVENFEIKNVCDSIIEQIGRIL